MWLQCSYSHFSCKNINLFENTLATTVREFVITKLIKLTILWTIGPRCPLLSITMQWQLKSNWQIERSVSICIHMWAFRIACIQNWVHQHIGLFHFTALVRLVCIAWLLCSVNHDMRNSFELTYLCWPYLHIMILCHSSITYSMQMSNVHDNLDLCCLHKK